MAVLVMWLDSIPHTEACRVSAVMSLLYNGIQELIKAREAYGAK